ncbi:P-loop NTPase family protein [Bacillus testis]|uniref:topology modulation protein n=1 Tax=Bacillus testis TaxID=1622072 RepID=UPI000A9F8081|nr:topology modulation protein [Bacillus testis]
MAFLLEWGSLPSALGAILQLPVYHLDAYFWKPGWIQAEEEEFRLAQEELAREEKWIIDGNYSSSLPTRMERADTIIYLELPLRTCLYRVLKRRVANHGKTRMDMAEGCPDKMDVAFIHFMISTYKARKAAMHKRLKEASTTKEVVILKSKGEVDGYLRTLKITS